MPQSAYSVRSEHSTEQAASFKTKNVHRVMPVGAAVATSLALALLLFGLSGAKLLGQPQISQAPSTVAAGKPSTNESVRSGNTNNASAASGSSSTKSTTVEPANADIQNSESATTKSTLKTRRGEVTDESGKRIKPTAVMTVGAGRIFNGALTLENGPCRRGAAPRRSLHCARVTAASNFPVFRFRSFVISLTFRTVVQSYCWISLEICTSSTLKPASGDSFETIFPSCQINRTRILSTSATSERELPY